MRRCEYQSLARKQSSSNPRISKREGRRTRLCRGYRQNQYNPTVKVRRPISQERPACQADPLLLVYSQGRIIKGDFLIRLNFIGEGTDVSQWRFGKRQSAASRTAPAP